MPVSKRVARPASSSRNAVAVPASVVARPTCESDSPIVCALDPPVPTPMTTRLGARSASVAIALAVTETWRECGTVTPGPSRMREVAAAHAASVTQSSRQIRCESVIHAVS